MPLPIFNGVGAKWYRSGFETGVEEVDETPDGKLVPDDTYKYRRPVCRYRFWTEVASDTVTLKNSLPAGGVGLSALPTVYLGSGKGATPTATEQEASGMAGTWWFDGLSVQDGPGGKSRVEYTAIVRGPFSLQKVSTWNPAAT